MIEPTVHYPKDIEIDNYVGFIFGNYIENTENYNVISYLNKNKNLNLLGTIYKNLADAREANNAELSLVGYYQNEKLYFMHNNQICIKKPYSLTLNIFSRNSGILETDKMLNKSIIISGCGSVGSLVALELARSGIGHFLLVDNDIFEYHNICRHQCGVNDVGKYKVDALTERILNINPSAKIIKQTTILERVSKEVFDNFCTENTIIVGCADSRKGDLYANRISYIYKVPLVSIGFWERAFAGEIFYSMPFINSCYHCQFGNMQKDEDNRINANHRFYIDESNIEEVSFEPGISIDINYVTTIGIKLIIDLLNKDDNKYIPKIIDELTQYTLVCNTNSSKIGGEMAEIFAYPLQVTTSIEVAKKDDCPICNV